LRLSPEQAIDINFIALKASEAANIPVGDVVSCKIVKRSIDARGRETWIQLKVRLVWGQEDQPVEAIPPFAARDVSAAPEVVVVGAGPAGLFAALRLIERGIRPIVIERGKDVSRRKKDVAILNKDGVLDPESNYCFGEGGAGTFSDGKIYTRSNKRGDVMRVLELFVLHGADPDILIESHPHLGTDKLPGIIENMRNTITGCGGQILFDTRLTAILADGSRATGVQVNNAGTISARAIVLATGHSARDVYEMMLRQGIQLQSKPFAMGVRVEHPRQLIDRIQYHGRNDPSLPSASYSLVTQVNNRGVYSFCMCPGGIIVPASTGSSELVVNGMSNSVRNSPYSNSGIAVEISLEDIHRFGDSALAGLDLQKKLEHAAWQNSTGAMKAPAQRLTDFVKGRVSQDLPRSSYIPGLCPSPLNEWLPGGIARRLQKGLEDFGTKMRGFMTSEAVVVGVESRTSSPVRMPRDPGTFQHTGVERLYVCGEGAGYAGGITSSALDGIACAERVDIH